MVYVKPAGDVLEIVGHCPRCGAPIYGKSLIMQDKAPTLTYSCECRAIPVMRYPEADFTLRETP